MSFKRSMLLNVFVRSSAALLLIAAVAKLVSAASSAIIMTVMAPIVDISYRNLFIMAGLTEFIVGIFLLFGKRPGLQMGLLAWLSTNILIYRFGLIWVGYEMPCRCLGNLTDALHISPAIADNIMKGVLAYLLVGSYASLFWLWRQRKQLASGRSEMGVGGDGEKLSQTP